MMSAGFQPAETPPPDEAPPQVARPGSVFDVGGRIAGRDAIAARELAQVRATNACGARGARDVAGVRGEELFDPGALPLAEYVVLGVSVGLAGARDRHTLRRPAQARGALDRIAELAHVAGPALGGELLDERVGDRVGPQRAPGVRGE